MVKIYNSRLIITGALVKHLSSNFINLLFFENVTLITNDYSIMSNMW